MKDGDRIRERVLESFEIRNWGLFSPGEGEKNGQGEGQTV